MVVLPRAARPMRQGTADMGNRTILKPDFQAGHPQSRIDHLRAGFSPDSVCLIGRKSPTPTPSPKPSQTGKADSCFLFWHGAGGQKMLEGKPWFVAADVCRALGIDNTATRRLDEDEKAALRLTQTSSNGTEQGRDVTIVNEPGLYSLVLLPARMSLARCACWRRTEGRYFAARMWRRHWDMHGLMMRLPRIAGLR